MATIKVVWYIYVMFNVCLRAVLLVVAELLVVAVLLVVAEFASPTLNSVQNIKKTLLFRKKPI